MRMSTSNSGTPLKNPEQEMLHCHKFITPPNFLTRIPKMMVWKRWLLLNMAMLVSTVYMLNYWEVPPGFFRKPLQFWDIPKITKVLKLDDKIWQMIFEYITISLGWTNKNIIFKSSSPFWGRCFSRAPYSRGWHHPEKKSLDSYGRRD